MKKSIAAVFFLAMSCAVACAEPPNFLFRAISTRLHDKASSHESTIVSEQSCSSFGANSPIAAADFQSRYPRGVFVVCDTQVSGDVASATVLKYIFHVARSRVLTAEEIHAKFSKRNDSWHVNSWKSTAIDY